MKHAISIAVLATTLSVISVPFLRAQEIRGIFNDADRGWHRSEINDGWRKRYAQGSVLLLHGVNLAPTTAQADSGSPLPRQLGGTSVRVIVGDTQVDAFLISVSSAFVRAVLPAWTPEGPGVVVVRHSGRDSFPRDIHVGRRDFRLYGRTPLGVLAHNIAPTGEWFANGFSQPAKPGQLVALWGTGLGTHSELGPIEVRVGGRRALIRYAGAAECCAGQDHVVFEVPAGIEGCHVPVQVKFPEGESNSPTLSIASGEGPCSDPYGLPINLLESGVLDAGRISAHAREPRLVPFPIEREHGVTDFPDDIVDGSLWGSFERAMTFSANTWTLPPMGTCFGEPGTIGPWFSPWETAPPPFDAGAALNLLGPHGLTNVPRAIYDRNIVGYGALLPDRLEPGEYVLSNGEGSGRVGPFQTTFKLDGSFEWTNKDSLTPAALENGVPITWEADNLKGGFVIMSASVGRWVEEWGFGAQELSSLTCVEKVEKQSFTIPRSVLALAAAADLLTVRVTYVLNHRFSAPGLDLAEFNYHIGNTARVLLPE